MKIHDIRQEYAKGTLTKEQLAPHPIEQFETWMQDAVKFVSEPTAFVLSTVNENKQPSSRIVLLKGFSKAGFTFFTNYASRKGKQIASNPLVSMTFFWPELERQIHIEGNAERISPEESELYFKSRPIESQIGATLSQQSQPLASKKVLMDDFLRLKEDTTFVPKRPENWGGYEISPTRIEFWQGGEYRLHDRFCYTKNGNEWSIERLNP